MQVKLKVLTGSHEGREIKVSGERFLVGRSESCQLRPKSGSVSRKHCILVIRDGRVLLQDLKSRNGTYVNGKALPTDKAKVLKPGDTVKIGKLMFELVIEHGLQAAKRPEVQGVGDAAARTVEAGANESRFEAVDVDSWLDEADQIERVRKLSDPETRHFKIDDSVRGVSDQDSTDLSVDGESKATYRVDKPDAAEGDRSEPKTKSEPKGLPASFKNKTADSSVDAAQEALKKFFAGR